MRDMHPDPTAVLVHLINHSFRTGQSWGARLPIAKFPDSMRHTCSSTLVVRWQLCIVPVVSLDSEAIPYYSYSTRSRFQTIIWSRNGAYPQRLCPQAAQLCGPDANNRYYPTQAMAGTTAGVQPRYVLGLLTCGYTTRWCVAVERWI